MEDFLRYLYGAMAHDAIWQYASEEQLQDAQMAIERSVMNRIFKLAFYPNQDGDILRDQWENATDLSQKIFKEWLKMVQSFSRMTHFIFQGSSRAY